MEENISWEAPEYIEYKKKADWYWYLALIAVLLLIFAAHERSFLFGTLVVIGWFTIMLYSSRPPRIIKTVISERGIQVEQSLYLWTNIKSFWIFPQKNEVSLKLKKTLIPHLKIPLANVDPEKIREFLIKFAHEKEQEESFIDNLSDLVKF